MMKNMFFFLVVCVNTSTFAIVKTKTNHNHTRILEQKIVRDLRG